MSTKRKSVLQLELGFKKLTIDDALILLQRERANGATHVAGLRIRWEGGDDLTPDVQQAAIGTATTAQRAT